MTSVGKLGFLFSWPKNPSLLYKTNRQHFSVCVCTAIDHRRRDHLNDTKGWMTPRDEWPTGMRDPQGWGTHRGEGPTGVRDPQGWGTHGDEGPTGMRDPQRWGIVKIVNALWTKTNSKFFPLKLNKIMKWATKNIEISDSEFYYPEEQETTDVC